MSPLKKKLTMTTTEQTTEQSITIDHDKSSLKQPPSAAGLPLLGNVFDLAKDTRDFLTKTYLELGPIFRVRALNQEFTVLAGTEANLFMMREGTNYFRSHEFWHGMDDELGAVRSMISMDGPEHTRFRKVQQRGTAVPSSGSNYPK